jgi:hypothetical protein
MKKAFHPALQGLSGNDPALPLIRRARDFRLYTEDGKRLRDLWQYGGRAVLGHKPPGVLREMKNAAERGLFAPLPSGLGKRFHRALEKAFPGCAIRVYPDREGLEWALDGLSMDGLRPLDPVFDGGSPKSAPGDRPRLWRPFMEGEPILPISPVPPGFSIPILPLPWTNAPWILINKSREGEQTDAFENLSPGELCSPLVLSAAIRALYDLIAAPPRSPRPAASSARPRAGQIRRPAAPPPLSVIRLIAKLPTFF